MMRAIGLDIGTSTICAVVLDGETGVILDTVTEQNNSFLKGKNFWERLQDPSTILRKVEEIISGLIKRHAPISGIGLTGQMHGIVYIGEDGAAVSPLYTWQDGRGDLPYTDGMSYAGYMTAKTGYKLATGYGAVTHFYNSIHGFVPDSARYFCTIHDYASMRLSNSVKVRLHPSNAASLGFYNLEDNCFDQQAIRAVGMDSSFFPEIADWTGLTGEASPQIPVAVSIGDNQASFLGAVRDKADCLSVNIGTSSQISIFTGEGIKNSPAEIRPFADTGFLLVGSPLCGGGVYALLEEFFQSVMRMATGKDFPQLYDVMDQTALDYLSGADKLEISTKFSGTRENPSERGDIRNLGTENFTAGHFIVGVLEGIAGELYDIYEAILPNIPSKPKRLVCSGNSIRLNKSLQKILSNTFQMPLSVPFCREEAAYGAALFSLVAVGFFKSTAEAQRLIKYSDL